MSFWSSALPALGAGAGFLIGGPAGAAVGATVGAGASSALSQQETNKMQMELAGRQTQFQADMSNTAHQREVADLRAAGLNPILSAKYGGASTPPGATAVISNPMADLPNNVNSASRLRLDSMLNKELLATEKSKQLANSAAASEAISRARKTDFEAVIAETEAAYRRSWLGRNMFAARDIAAVARDAGISLGQFKSMFNPAQGYKAGMRWR